MLTLVLVFQNVNYYMFTYRTKMYFQDANGEYAMEVGEMAKSLGSSYQIYVLGQPRIFSGFPTLAFLAPDNPRSDLDAEALASLDLAAGQKSAFFAIPENSSLLAEIGQKYWRRIWELSFASPGQMKFCLSITSFPTKVNREKKFYLRG